MSKSTTTLEWRVAQLELNYKEMDKKLSSILENHLPHIQAEVEGLSNRITVLTGVNIIGIIIVILLERLLS